MVDDVLDWTFAEAPTDDAPAGTAVIVSKIMAPPTPARTRAWRRPHAPRWLPLAALVLGGLLTALGAATQVVAASGWARIEQQVGEAVVYEEAQSRAGQVSALLAAQVHSDGGWLAERRLEVSQNQPAPNPAPQLHLLPGAPLVTSMTAPYIDQAQVTVVRRYADAAGRIYQFELVQTYVSAQPSIWLRQPTELASMHTTATWAGTRLAATFPLADQDWMSANLPLIEADLETACAGGQCLGIMVPLVFTSTLPPPPSSAGQIVLLSPHLAGLPHDEAASQALRAGITARVLSYLYSRT